MGDEVLQYVVMCGICGHLWKDPRSCRRVSEVEVQCRGWCGTRWRVSPVLAERVSSWTR